MARIVFQQYLRKKLFRIKKVFHYTWTAQHVQLYRAIQARDTAGGCCLCMALQCLVTAAVLSSNLGKADYEALGALGNLQALMSRLNSPGQRCFLAASSPRRATSLPRLAPMKAPGSWLVTSIRQWKKARSSTASSADNRKQQSAGHRLPLPVGRCSLVISTLHFSSSNSDSFFSSCSAVTLRS